MPSKSRPLSGSRHFQLLNWSFHWRWPIHWLGRLHHPTCNPHPKEYAVQHSKHLLYLEKTWIAMIPWPTCWPASPQLTILAQHLDLQLQAEFFYKADWFGVLKLLGNSTRPNHRFRCFMSSFWFPIPQLHHCPQLCSKPSCSLTKQHGPVANNNNYALFALLCHSPEQFARLAAARLELDSIQDYAFDFCFSRWTHLWLCLASRSLSGSPDGLLRNMLLWLHLRHGTCASSFWFGPPFGWHREVVSWFYSPLSSMMQLV